jgi:hypothetical protein
MVMDDRIWWYEWNGRQAGPVAHAALVQLVRSGQLRPESRIWRSGMPGWQAVQQVPEIAGAVPDAGSPPSPTPSPSPTPTPTATASASASTPSPPGALEPISVGALVGLGIVTLGIYPMVKFYQAATAYEALAARRSRFATYFWLFVGLALFGGPLHAVAGPLAIMVDLAAIAFAVLTLFEVLAVRSDAVRRMCVAPVLTPDSTHKALFITGALTWWLVVGLVFLAVQAVRFFQDHNAFAEALRARDAAAAPTVAPPAAPVTGPGPVPGPVSPAPAGTADARLCASCGNPLAAPARFCDQCGTPVRPQAGT